MGKKRVLVTGAGGFIGSHLVETLVKSGAEVRAFVHYRGNGSWGWLDHSDRKNDIDVVAGDITDRDNVSAAVKGVDVVFHLAALIGIPFSYDAPASYVRTNIEGTLNVLLAAREADVERVIHTSTSEVYGTARYVPINEDHPLQGQSPYSASKIGADKLAESFHLSFGLRVVTIRPFNTFGPRQSARAVIPTIISQCLDGTAVRLGSQSPTRDFNYVSNTVDAFIRCADSPNAIGKTINVGSGVEISIGDLVRKIGKLLGREIRVETELNRTRPPESEVERLLADNAQAKAILNWAPTVSLDEGLISTADWIRANPDQYRTRDYAI
ncbi:MAG TPA: SDR family NAD(P)-dependent oxidoreductase [Terriglobia bacterium]|nr:SDR family NAD(P)-dependent oxidoreductase [Terriglobia bacterium]